MDEVLTWAAIEQMDETALNLAIEKHCTTHNWKLVPTGADREHWVLIHPDIEGTLWSTVPHLHYTASWERAMELAWRYAIEINIEPATPRFAEIEAWDAGGGLRAPRLEADTEHETRVAVCRLALWRVADGYSLDEGRT